MGAGSRGQTWGQPLLQGPGQSVAVTAGQGRLEGPPAHLEQETPRAGAVAGWGRALWEWVVPRLLLGYCVVSTRSRPGPCRASGKSQRLTGPPLPSRETLRGQMAATVTHAGTPSPKGQQQALGGSESNKGPRGNKQGARGVSLAARWVRVPCLLVGCVMGRWGRRQETSLSGKEVLTERGGVDRHLGDGSLSEG